jgi:hypothetical protein
VILVSEKKYNLNEDAYLARQDQMCAYETCNQIALHGSHYCFFHILEDRLQTLFVRCP